jgi:hypothetical protein
MYRELVADGFPEGVAAEDGVGLVYEGTELVEAVSWRPDGQAFRVGRGSGSGSGSGSDGVVSEEPISVRAL